MFSNQISHPDPYRFLRKHIAKELLHKDEVEFTNSTLLRLANTSICRKLTPTGLASTRDFFIQ